MARHLTDASSTMVRTIISPNGSSVQLLLRPVTRATCSSHKIKSTFPFYSHFSLVQSAKCTAAPGEPGKWIDVPECLRVCPSIEVSDDYNVEYSQSTFSNGTILIATCKNNPRVTDEEKHK